MKTILAWLSAHPVATWLLTGFDVLAAVIIVCWLAIWLLAFLAIPFYRWRNKDRSGANLSDIVFAVRHDDASDEIVFSWILTNRGKFEARRLRTGASFYANLSEGRVVSWRLNREVAALASGDHVEIAIRVARAELSRQACEFDNGSVSLWCHYSSASPKKPAGNFITTGPRQRFNLAVGQVGGQDCVTVIDLTPVDFHQRLKTELMKKRHLARRRV